VTGSGDENLRDGEWVGDLSAAEASAAQLEQSWTAKQQQ
jgi:hypothetical protein